MLHARIPTDKSVSYWHSVPAGTKKPTPEREDSLPLGEGWGFGEFGRIKKMYPSEKTPSPFGRGLG